MLSRRCVFSLSLITCLLMGAGLVGADPPSQRDTLLRYGDVIEGQISETRPEEIWRFEGYAGDLILIDAQADDPGSLDTTLTLLDSQENTLFIDDDGGEGYNSRIGPFELPGDDAYSIVASGYSGHGAYMLTLVNLRTVPAIKLDKPLAGIVDSTHPSDYFLLAAPADGDTLLRLDVHSDQPTGDPILALYNAAGYVSGTEEQGKAAIDPFVPVPDDIYAIVVSWNPDTRGGPYELRVSQSGVELLQDGVPQTGALNYDEAPAYHYFRGETDQQVRLTVRVIEGDISPRLLVETADHDLALFTSDCHMTLETSIVLNLPRSAVYAIEVQDGLPTDNPGTYEISLEWMSD
ncbi:MAG: hypothetical protein JXJ20_12520 [Anaerolineae bacterium]|nr:hypothetical protein [Anaerolineae bacterium]